MTWTKSTALALAAFLALGSGCGAISQSHAQNVGEKTFNYPTNKDTADVVLGGYDLVAYFDDKSATKGSPEHAVRYGGNIYYFANEDH